MGTNGTKAFDVMIFRISHPHIPFSEITEATIHETVNMTKELFGVKKIILLNIPFNNNIRTTQDLEDWKLTNNMIDRVASSYSSELTGERAAGNDVQVTVLHFAQWTNMLMQHNAQAIGWNTSDAAGNFNESYPLGRLGCKRFPASIAQACAEKVNPGVCVSRQNRVSLDGLHFCLESIGGRLAAGLACLMNCFRDPIEGYHLNAGELEQCETQCNKLFMSFQPLPI